MRKSSAYEFPPTPVQDGEGACWASQLPQLQLQLGERPTPTLRYLVIVLILSYVCYLLSTLINCFQLFVHRQKIKTLANLDQLYNSAKLTLQYCSPSPRALVVNTVLQSIIIEFPVVLMDFCLHIYKYISFSNQLVRNSQLYSILDSQMSHD